MLNSNFYRSLYTVVNITLSSELQKLEDNEGSYIPLAIILSENLELEIFVLTSTLLSTIVVL